MFVYKTTGTCSKEISIETEGDLIKSVRFTNGCSGNLQGMSVLLIGMPIADAIEKLRGIKCQNNTSCPDQLSKALEALLKSKESA